MNELIERAYDYLQTFKENKEITDYFFKTIKKLNAKSDNDNETIVHIIATLCANTKGKYNREIASFIIAVIAYFDKNSEDNNIIEEAIKIVEKREKEYGDASMMAYDVASMFKKISEKNIDAFDVILTQIALKLVREENMHKRDNLIDIIGYLIVYDKYYDHVLRMKAASDW